MVKDTYYYTQSLFEKTMNSHNHPEDIKQVRIAPELYNWLKTYTRKTPICEVALGKSKFKYVTASGHEILIVEDDSVLSWIIEMKEEKEKGLNNMIIELTDVEINGLAIEGDVKLIKTELGDSIHHLYVGNRYDYEVTMEPGNFYEGVIVHGIVTAMMHHPQTLMLVQASIVGRSKQEPWKTYTLHVFVKSYEVKNGCVPTQTHAKHVLFSVSQYGESINKDKLPKVDIGKLTEDEAHYIHGLLLAQGVNVQEGSVEDTLRRKLVNQVQSILVKLEGGKK